MKKEYVLRIIVNDEDDVAELLTEYYEDTEEVLESCALEVEGEHIEIPASVMKYFVKLESDLLGIS